MISKNNNLFWVIIIILIVFVLSSCNSPVQEIKEEKTLQDRLDKLTENGEFEKVVNLINTPEKLINYETRQFEHYLDKNDERPVGFVKFTPQKMFDEQVGSCSSFSVFESYVLDQHSFDVFTLYYISEFNNSDPLYGDIYGHTITVYKDSNNNYKYLTNVGNSQFAIYGPFNEISEIITKEEKRTDGKIFYHGYVHLGYVGEEIKDNNFTEAVSKLKTPTQILNYIARNFKLETNYTGSINNPEVTFNDKKGTRRDLYSLISYILNQNGYETNILKYQAEIDGNQIIDSLVIYKVDGNWKSIIDYTGSEPLNLRSIKDYSSIPKILSHVEDFIDLPREEDLKIIKYGLIEPGTTDFTINNWIDF